MRTYNISISENLMQKAIGTFSSTESMQEWIQQKVEWLLIQHIAQEKTAETQPHRHTHALTPFRGILRGTDCPSDIREEHVAEKYGI